MRLVCRSDSERDKALCIGFQNLQSIHTFKHLLALEAALTNHWYYMIEKRVLAIAKLHFDAPTALVKSSAASFLYLWQLDVSMHYFCFRK